MAAGSDMDTVVLVVALGSICVPSVVGSHPEGAPGPFARVGT